MGLTAVLFLLSAVSAWAQNPHYSASIATSPITVYQNATSAPTITVTVTNLQANPNRDIDSIALTLPAGFSGTTGVSFSLSGWSSAISADGLTITATSSTTDLDGGTSPRSSMTISFQSTSSTSGNTTVGVVCANRNGAISNLPVSASFMVEACTAVSTVTTQPSNQTLCAGADAGFSAAADGTSGATLLQWQISTDDGASWTNVPSATSSPLTVSSVTESMDGDRYRAAFTSLCGASTVYSNEATLAVSAPLSVSDPAGVTATSGDDALFGVTASGGASVQWQQSTDAGTTWDDIDDATSPTLTLVSVTTSMSGRLYRASASAPCGSTTSAASSLTVNQITTTTTVTDATSGYGDASVTLAATVAPADAPGTLSFSVDGTPVGSGALTAGAASISFDPSSLGAGPHEISVSYDGASEYATSIDVGALTVAKAPLTVTADHTSRDYGDANPPLTVSYSGFVNGETPGDLGGTLDVSTTATATSEIGPWPIIASGYTSDNYIITFVPGTLTVEPATLTITAPSLAREYGDANPPLDGGYSGAKNGETFVVTGSTLATPESAVDDYEIIPDVTGPTLANYEVEPINGTLSVEPATLTITAPSPTREYGEPNPSLDGGYSGAKNDDVFVVTGSTTADLESAVDDYPVIPHVTGAKLGNYLIDPHNGVLTVGKATLTITAPSLEREYGEPNPPLVGGYSGQKNGETFIVTGSTDASQTSDVGPYAVVPDVTGETIANYDILPVNGILSVEPATLTITAPSPTREYGEPNPSLDGGYSGAKNDDVFVVTGSTTADLESPVDDYPVIPDVTGAELGNYLIDPHNGVLTVGKATLTITGPSLAREYGDANPPLDGGYSGAKNGETFVVTGSTSATPESAVDEYEIIPHVTGPTLANYEVEPVNGALSVEPATLTITAPSPTRQYGDPNPPLNGGYSGAKNLETFVVTGSTSATPESPVDVVYAVMPHVTGETLANYVVVAVPGTLTIEPATLTITAPSPTREYGEPNPPLDGGYSGAKNLETFVVTGSTTATPESPVDGDYPVIPHVTGETLPNYVVVAVPGTLTIEKAMLTITAPTLSREYGDANPDLGGTFEGAKNLETFTITGITLADEMSEIGDYAIVPDVTGETLANYDVTRVDGLLTIGTATLTIIADDKMREYGELNPELTGSYSGEKNGELFTLSFENTSSPTTSVGNHPIVPSVIGETLSNYTVAKTDGTLTITPATLEIFADDKSRIYGSENPELTGTHGATKNGESFSLSFTTDAATDSPVVPGGYSIVPHASGGTLGNYTVVSHDGTLTITKKDLVVTAENKSRIFGAPEPVFTVVYDGFELADDASVLGGAPSFSTDATASSPAGFEYYIRPALGSLESVNYEFSSFVDGILSITTATTATATTLSPATVQYSDRTIVTATIVGVNAAAQAAVNLGGVVTFSLVDGATVTVLGEATSYDIVGGMLTATAQYAILEPQGSYAIRAAFVPTSADITGSSADATLTVTRETAELQYNGTTAFSTNPTTNAATITLSASVIDINDAARGRIMNATVDFLENTPAGSVINTAAEDVEVGAVNTGDTINGIANSESFSYTLSTSEVNDGGTVLTVYPVARGEYYGGSSSEPGLIAVVLPGADYVNGGGYMVVGSSNGSTTSAGTYAANAGSRVNFGFTMKYTRSGRNLKGQSNIIFRRTEADGIVHTYQIKSNAINSLTVTEVKSGGIVIGRRGVFNTKATLTDITDPLLPISKGGNLDLTVDAYEAVAATESNSIGVSLIGANSTLLFGSTWTNNSLARATLGGGAIRVRNTSGAAKPVLEETTAQSGIAQLRQNTPNPFAGSTTIEFNVAEASHVTLTIVDVHGSMVARLLDGEVAAGTHARSWSAMDETGRRIPGGVYFYRLTARSSEGVDELIETRQMVITR